MYKIASFRSLMLPNGMKGWYLHGFVLCWPRVRAVLIFYDLINELSIFPRTNFLQKLNHYALYHLCTMCIYWAIALALFKVLFFMGNLFLVWNSFLFLCVLYEIYPCNHSTEPCWCIFALANVCLACCHCINLRC